MNDDLLSCPFCGAPNFELEVGEVKDPLAYWDMGIRGIEHGYVSCPCGAIVKAYDKWAAIEQWNTRADKQEEINA